MPVSMPDLAGIALAAGEARRLRPISRDVAKPLCPVGPSTLLDHALARLAEVGAEPAVNVHHHADAIVAAVGGRARVSHERTEALGTAGAVGALRAWIDARPVVVVNADTWCVGGLPALLAGWDGTTVRLLVPGGGPFGPTSPVTGCVLPAAVASSLAPVPSGLYEVVWRDAAAAGRLEVVAHDGPVHDCGTPRRLLAANLDAVARSGSSIVAGDAVVEPDAIVVDSVVGDGCRVAGQMVGSVALPGTEVAPGEVLRGAIRWRSRDRDRTVLVR